MFVTKKKKGYLVTEKRKDYFFVSMLLFCLFSSTLLTISEARGDDLRVAIGLGGAGTEWRGDGSFTTQFKFGYRFANVFGVYGDFNLSYSAVDQRVITMFAIGVQAWGKLGPTRPYARFSLIHQHEESLSVIAGDFFRAIIGIGEGIRHRGGLGLSLGADWPFYKHKKIELFLSLEGFIKWFPGDMGPAIYAGGLLGFGMNFSV